MTALDTLMLSVSMLSVDILSVANNPIVLRVVMLSVFRLNVILLNVVAPVFPRHRNQNKSSKLKGRKTKASGDGRVGRALEFGDKKLKSLICQSYFMS